MNRIQSFRGWRYDMEKAGAADLNELLTPPYDVINPVQQADYYERHPNNIIRVILGRDQVGDGDEANRYTRAAGYLAQWQARGVLRQEAAPAIYVLQEHFPLPDGGLASRTGLIARLRLAPWGEGILRHERTFPAAKADRLALTIATRSQFSPIFALYSDPSGDVQAVLHAACHRPPDSVLNDDDGVSHALWAVTEQDCLEATAAALAERTFYIADGHHRYETALNYQRFRRTGVLPDSPPPNPLSSWEAVPGYRQGAGTRPGGQLEAFDYTWSYFACMEDPGVSILPTHRCVHGVDGFDAQKLMEHLRVRFDLMRVADDHALLDALHQFPSGEHAYALVLPGDRPGYLLRLRPDARIAELLHKADHPTVAAIDVAALQTLVFEPLLGIGRDVNAQKRHLRTLPGSFQAIAEARAGICQAVFLVNPTTLEQLRTASEAGQVMPPKATYFYPKLPSGLVINCVE